MAENRRKSKVGVVVGTGMQKTVKVQVERRVVEPTFGKTVTRRKKFLAHDEKQECRLGDQVEIEETRPISKRKCWKVTAILKKGLEVVNV